MVCHQPAKFSDYRYCASRDIFSFVTWITQLKDHLTISIGTP